MSDIKDAELSGPVAAKGNPESDSGTPGDTDSNTVAGTDVDQAEKAGPAGPGGFTLSRDKVGQGFKLVRDKAGPSTALVLRKTTQVTVYLRRFNKRHTAPTLSGAGRWFAGRLSPRSVARDYRRMLAGVHAMFFDRSEDAYYFVRTRGHVAKSGLTIPSQVRAEANDYRPTPVRIFHWAMSALPEDLQDYVFVDYGAGRGRALLMASHYPFDQIKGAEIAAELHDDCLMNIAQYPRSLMKCRDIECHHTRATTLPTPEEPAVFFFFNPFDLSVFEKVLARITRSYKRNRRQMFLICIDMDERELVAAPGIFHPLALPAKQRFRAALFSPYTVRVYRTDP